MVGKTNSLRTLIGFAVLVVLCTSPALADWPQFRGTNSSGIGTGETPTEFGPGKNELWRLPLAAGHSSPCVAGNSIFVTTYEEKNKELAVVCIDRSNGRIRWQRALSVKEFEKGHPSFNPASSSPASDGERVVAYFGSYGLLCLDMQGEKLWDFKMPIAKSFGGNAASPAIIGDRVILYRGTYNDHFLLAVDKNSGNELWRVPQTERFTAEMASTACPIIVGDKLIVHTVRSMQAFDINSGDQIWVAKCATTATSTPILAGDEVIVAAWNKMGEPALRPDFPSFEELIAENDKNDDKLISRDELPVIWIFHRPEGIEAPMNGGKIRFEGADKNRDERISDDEWASHVRDVEKYRDGYETHGMLAIPVNSEGVVDAEKVRTLATQGIPEVPSPLFDGEHVYYVKNGGVLTCLNLKTGERVYRMRTSGKGTHYASPFIAGGKLYTVSGDGLITVVKLGDDPEILATNDMGESVYASPAVVDGTIYVRTHSTLFAFRQD